MLKRAARSGFTLIELIIAVAIGVFVVGAIYNVFTNQTKQLLYQDIQMEMHQNLRLATDVLTRTSRMAGYGTSGRTYGLLGYTNGAASGDAPMPAIVSYNSAGPNGSDAITLVTMEPGLTMNTSSRTAPDCSTTTLSFEPTAFNNAARLAALQAGETIMCLDYAAVGEYRSYLWQITAVDATAGEVYVSSNQSAFVDFDGLCGGNLPLVMTCSRAEVATFYIDADGTDGVGAGSAEHPVLMMDLDFSSPDANDVPVVDHIEDMQIEYCLRSPIGGTNCTAAADWVNSIDDYNNSIESDDPDDVYMIRVSFVVKSGRDDPQKMRMSARPALADNSAGSTEDYYFRQTLSTEVMVRNMRLQNMQ